MKTNKKQMNIPNKYTTDKITEVTVYQLTFSRCVKLYKIKMKLCIEKTINKVKRILNSKLETISLKTPDKKLAFWSFLPWVMLLIACL